MSIKYHPGGNYVGYFANNVFPPIAETLGPEWARLPPSWTRCPSRDVQAMTEPNVIAAAGKAKTSLQLFVGSFFIAGLIVYEL